MALPEVGSTVFLHLDKPLEEAHFGIERTVRGQQWPQHPALLSQKGVSGHILGLGYKSAS